MLNNRQVIVFLIGVLLFIGDLCLPWRGRPDTSLTVASGRVRAAYSTPLGSGVLIGLPLSVAAIVFGTGFVLYALRKRAGGLTVAPPRYASDLVRAGLVHYEGAGEK